jgi:SynChlorMet cassette protein ScmD
LPDNDKPIANASIVLREEFDEWAVLFDPETGKAHGLNPFGVFVWKRLDGKNTIDDIFENVKTDFENVSAEAKNDITEFVQNLVNNGLVGYEI